MELGPVTGQDKCRLAGRQGPVVVDEPDPAVELPVAGKVLFDAGRTDQDQADAGPVVMVT
jgi:hypothetical protein